MNVLLASLIPGEGWIVVLVVAFLLFGNRLPQVMRNLGRGVTEFKKGVQGIEDDSDSHDGDAPAPKPKKQETTQES